MISVAKSKFPEYQFLVRDVMHGIEGKYSLILAVYGQINHFGLDEWSKIISKNLWESGSFYSVIYADTKNPDIAYENGKHQIFTENEIRSKMNEIGVEYTLHGFSFPFDPDMDSNELFEYQVCRMYSGDLMNCKYWILEGKSPR